MDRGQSTQMLFMPVRFSRRFACACFLFKIQRLISSSFFLEEEELPYVSEGYLTTRKKQPYST